MRGKVMVCAAVAAAGSLALAAVALGVEPPAQWKTLGIGGGGAMFGPSINPQNANELYVGCDMSPLFHSTDAGRNWQTMPFMSLRNYHHSAVAFTQDPQVLWAVGVARAPYRSADGGKTWAPCKAPGQTPVLYADYHNPERALVAAGGDLCLTADGGKTFASRFKGGGRLHLAGAFFDGETIYAGSGTDGLLVSADGGKTFAKSAATGLPAGFMTSLAGGKAGDKVKLYCVLSSAGQDMMYSGALVDVHKGFQGVFVLDPAKGAWEKKVNGLGKAHPIFVKKALTDADVAYVGGGSADGHPTVYKTTDGGENWADVFQTVGNKNIQMAWFGDKGERGWGFGEYAEGFGASALDNKAVILTDMGGAFLTQDGGATWRSVYSTPDKERKIGEPIPLGASYSGHGMEVTNVWRLIWLDPNNIFTCMTDIKGMVSRDGGKSWSFNYQGHNLNTMYNAVKAPAGDTVYAATSSVHDIYHSSWMGDSKLERGAKGLLLASKDKFATWTVAHDFAGMAINNLAFDVKVPTRLYVGAVHHVNGGIYASEDPDQGAKSTWTKLAAPPRTEGHPLSLVPLKDGSLLCTFSGRRTGNNFTPSSGVFWSPDGGKTWEDRSDPAMQLWTKDIVVDPGDPAQNTWYVGVGFDWGNSKKEQAGLYRTADRGKTWKKIADAALGVNGEVLTVDSCAFVPDHPEAMFFSTEECGLYFTRNVKADKPVFEQLKNFPFRHPRYMFFNPFNKKELWVCTAGNGILVGEVGP